MIGGALLAAGVPATAAAGPTIVDLGMLPGDTDSSAVAINDGGVIVGSSTNGTRRRAVRWSTGGTITDLGVPAGDTSSSASGVNAGGVVVGYSSRPAAPPYPPYVLVYQPVRWAPDGTMTVLPLLPGTTTGMARGINDAGVVVGNSGSFPVRWEIDGTITKLPLSGSGSAQGDHINNHDVVAGWAAISSPSNQHAARWANGGFTDLGTLSGDSNSWTEGINDAGVVVGFSYPTDAERAVRWTVGGVIQQLPSLAGGGSGRANGINDSGAIVGYDGPYLGSYRHAVRWNTDGTITDLGTLSGSVDSRAQGVNAGGEIVGVSFVSGKSHAVRWPH
ncbi:hypothetical protein [Actinocrispum wychmicini]|uniref:Putative HAF family extracellular repeat protein n=1 Tax=Actinocrispum wychmicini TaxID=1213861 RepID=A0A4R2IN71_9PSEU|nr:hypothetical protein [Actinocrispum wychmicini]TCO46513.1 putative HAF family extracellular repeat protein [Actinocrispum wychmicini]